MSRTWPKDFDLSYQAVYDAAFKQFDISYITMQAQQALANIELENIRPSVLFKPKLKIDGNRWCAIYGDNLQDGIAGFGESPDQAMYDFDKCWREKIK